ncbi:MAG TPA: hypothetical protein VGK73_31570 [Polyangiaceae bacterium]
MREAKDSPECQAFFADLMKVYEKHGLAICSFDGSPLSVIDLERRHRDGWRLADAYLEGACDERKVGE